MITLLKTCGNIQEIIDGLFSKGHLTDAQREKLKSITTSDGKMWDIVLNCLMRGSIQRFNDFMHILRQHNWHIAETIQIKLETLTEGIFIHLFHFNYINLRNITILLSYI